MPVVGSELGIVLGEIGGRTYYVPSGFLPNPGESDFPETAEEYIDDQDDFYDPYNQDDDDIWDPDPPPPPPIDFEEVPSYANERFSVFFVGVSDLTPITAASYPYHHMENGVPLFRYTITPTASQTVFTVTDNIGSFSVTVNEPIYGQFCALMTLRAGEMIVRLWGGGTSDPTTIAGVSTRNVTFDYREIIG